MREGDLLEVLEVWIDDYLHKHTEHKSSGQMAYEIAEHVQREGWRIPAPDQYVDSDVDSLGDLPSSWPTNEAESAALAESVKPVGLGTFARTAAIIATPEPAKQGLRELLKEITDLYAALFKDTYHDLDPENVASIASARKALSRTPPQKPAETPPAEPGLRDAILCHIERIKHKDGIAIDIIAHHGWEHADGDSCNVCAALTPPQKPAETPARWVCSECGKEFDHRPGPHRVKYGGPLCDGTAIEKGSERWVCDDCMMRDMTEAEGNAHHASTGHSVSSK